MFVKKYCWYFWNSNSSAPNLQDMVFFIRKNHQWLPLTSAETVTHCWQHEYCNFICKSVDKPWQNVSLFI